MNYKIIHKIKNEINRVQKRFYPFKEESYLFYDNKKVVIEKKEFEFLFEKDYECIFIHIPKTAGCSVTKGLFDKDWGLGHLDIRHYQKHLKEECFEKYFKFAFVRNPWDRAFSAYSYLKKGGSNTPWDIHFMEKYIKGYDSFEAFIYSLKDDPVKARELSSECPHFRPQYTYICNQKHQILIDYVAKFENINEEFIIIANKLNIKSAYLAHNNKSTSKSYKNMYTSKEMIDTIGKLYYNDIKLFKYKFDRS